MTGKKTKLTYGVGINDADYIQQIKETIRYVDGKQTIRSGRIC